MNSLFPSPGNGYVIREYLGGGVWKRAFRASSTRSTADVALLYPHDDSRSDMLLKDVARLIRVAGVHEYSSYLAQFYGFERGEDGRLFIVEELLDRPLDRLHPLHDLVMFSRIARDLCRGLCCLHESKLVHRDLKLDNCGMDQLQRAKIFDLGSVTSEPGGVEGTIFTRAPELFLVRATGSLFAGHLISEKATHQADIWALGATLFALRSGKYPFVLDSEVAARRRINDKILKLKNRSGDALAAKAEIDRAIAARIARKGAFDDLRDRVQAALKGAAGEILCTMLDGDPGKRFTAREYEQKWSELSNELGGAGSVSSERADKWAHIDMQLNAVEQREFQLTRKQLERLISELDQAKKGAKGTVDRRTYERLDKRLRQIKSARLQSESA